VLIVGVSTRAAAESAARAGYEVTAIDAFGDRDQHAGVRVRSMPRDVGTAFTPSAVARVARGVGRDATVYLSGFENHPRAVAGLARGGAVWGNAPDVLRRVRDPDALADVLRRRGLPGPATRRTAPPGGETRWLQKPLASGGGHGVRVWRGGRVPPRAYLQEYVEGVPAAVAFVADGERAAILGITRQLVGERAFGASGFRYCGSVWSTAGDDAIASPGLAGACARVAGAVVEAFGLVGVGGIDVMVWGERALPVEVNPRWTGSLEVLERARGDSVFAAHAAACRERRLPDSRTAAPGAERAVGKAVVFSRADVTIGDTSAWLADPDVRDVPHEGERIAAGRPVCTVFAEGRRHEDCRSGLVARAGRIYADLATWTHAAVTMAP
jgi:predicted ATP-grasp superfamily ATP-dependent carboligase